MNFCLRSAASGPSAVRSRGRERTEGGFLAAQRCSAVPGPFLDYPRGRCTLHRPSGGRIHVPTSVRTCVLGGGAGWTHLRNEGVRAPSFLRIESRVWRWWVESARGAPRTPDAAHASPA